MDAIVALLKTLIDTRGKQYIVKFVTVGLVWVAASLHATSADASTTGIVADWIAGVLAAGASFGVDILSHKIQKPAEPKV